MKDALLKRSVTIQGHATSLTLEPVFWEALRAAAAEEGLSINALVARIDTARDTNLSSAVRVWLFRRSQARGASPSGGNQASSPAFAAGE